MLKIGKLYRRNDGQWVEVAGRIGAYSREMPYVWSISGDWYDEKTGAFVGSSVERGYYLRPVNHWSSVSDHTHVKDEEHDAN